jgi:DNA-binding beta-propeller fold protein YncE
VSIVTTAATQPGRYGVTVKATDSCGVSSEQKFILTIRTVTCSTELKVAFVADTANHRIQRFDGTAWSVVGSGVPGNGVGQFRSPESVAASPDGRTIYVADLGNSRIQWSRDGGATWAVFATSVRSHGIALDRDGNLYVSDTLDSRVLRYDRGVPGTPVLLATPGSGAGQVREPHGLAIDCSMTLYIADMNNSRILRIAVADIVNAPNAGVGVAGPGSGLNPGQVFKPHGVAVDGSGKLYVADTGNSRILYFAGALPGPATVLCATGVQLGQVQKPEGVTVSAFGVGPLAGGPSVLVSDTSNNRIQGSRLPANAGSWMLVPPPAGGGLGAGVGQFMAPSKIR